MLVITSNYPEQMPDGSVSGAKVMLDGIDDHAGWHIRYHCQKNI
ncbi:phage protein [Streptococcus dysgalactiae]|nr:phage protein [Streptococcus dysgalactiae]